MKTGVIILSHGSRLPEAQDNLKGITANIEASITEDFLIEGASLQFNQPDLPAAIAHVIERGAKRVVVVPIFLYLGMHMQHDIPEVLAEQRNLYPDIKISISEHIGTDLRLQDIIMDRVKEAIV